MGYSPNETFLKDALAPSSPPFWRAAVLEKKKQTHLEKERVRDDQEREREEGERKGFASLASPFPFQGKLGEHLN